VSENWKDLMLEVKWVSTMMLELEELDVQVEMR
jgi:hypothetical protein